MGLYNRRMKKCTNKTCKQQNPQPLTNFFRRGTKYQSWCKLCKKSHDHNTYKTKPHRRKALKQSTAKYRMIAEEYVIAHLRQNPCKCGNSNILNLQFDHIRDKEFEISIGIMQGYSLERIKTEIEKCQVLCANCHSIKSAHQLKSWRLKWLAQSE